MTLPSSRTSINSLVATLGRSLTEMYDSLVKTVSSLHILTAMQEPGSHGWRIISSPTALLSLMCEAKMFSRKVLWGSPFTESGRRSTRQFISGPSILQPELLLRGFIQFNILLHLSSDGRKYALNIRVFTSSRWIQLRTRMDGSMCESLLMVLR